MNVTHPESESTPIAGFKFPATSGTLFLADQTIRNTQSMSEATGSDLSITVKNGVATLSGVTGSTAESNMVEYLVSRMKGVEQVINLIAHG